MSRENHVCGKCTRFKGTSKRLDPQYGVCKKNSGRATFLFVNSKSESCNHFTTEKETSESNVALNNKE